MPIQTPVQFWNITEAGLVEAAIPPVTLGSGRSARSPAAGRSKSLVPTAGRAEGTHVTPFIWKGRASAEGRGENRLLARPTPLPAWGKNCTKSRESCVPTVVPTLRRDGHGSLPRAVSHTSRHTNSPSN